MARWLTAHEDPHYVLIDDKLTGLEPLHERLVLVDNYQGLAAHNVDRALQLLEVPLAGLTA